MSAESFARRYWNSLTVADLVADASAFDRDRGTKSFWRRYIASLLDIPLDSVGRRTVAMPSPDDHSPTNGQLSAPLDSTARSISDADARTMRSIEEAKLRAVMIESEVQAKSATLNREVERVTEELNSLREERARLERIVEDLRGFERELRSRLSEIQLFAILVQRDGAVRRLRLRSTAVRFDRALSSARTCATDVDSIQPRLPSDRITEAALRFSEALEGLNEAIDILVDAAPDVIRLSTLRGFDEVASSLRDVAEGHRQFNRFDDELDVALDEFDSALEELEHVNRVLDRLTNDFRGEDLSDVDLSGVLLGGVRWDLLTRWPPDWVERIRRESSELTPGVFEINYGLDHDRNLASTAT